jgi:trehalose-6-phosphate synthase/Kef-type K+ transport system membrane component KefB
MKRAVALVAVFGTMILIRSQGRSETLPLHSLALVLGFALIAAVIVGDLVRRVRLPRLTGYLLFGVACGPYLANLISHSVARELQVVNALAVALIAFIAGLEMNVDRLRPRLAAIARFSGVTVAVALPLLMALAWLVWPWLSAVPDVTPLARLAPAALLAIIVASASPLVTIAVIADSRARGPVSEFVLAVSVFADLVLIMCFTVAVQVARWTVVGAPDVSLLAGLSWALAGSIAFGALVGAAFAIYMRLGGREVTVVLLAVAVVLGQVSRVAGFEPILAGITAGAIVSNASRPQGNVLRDAIGRGAMPVLVIFFAVAGASLDLAALASLGVLALLFAAVRFGALWLGTRLGGRAAGLDADLTRHGLMALVSQAGITIGLASIVGAEFPGWGTAVQAIALALVALHEVVGPIVLRSSLERAGETGPSTAKPLVVVSNREPYVHSYAAGGRIHCPPTAGGVAVALDALMRDRGGVWIAHGSGDADRAVVDERDHVRVPPDRPSYSLRRIWIDEPEFSGYYGGFANEGLWPLCHVVDVRPSFRAEDWAAYQRVNDRFAAVIDEELTDAATPVFIQDYHLALVAARLRERRPGARSALFWHIPWPSADRLRVCPWRREILSGLLANDLLAFQVERDRRNFLQAAADELRAEQEYDTSLVRVHGRQTAVVSVPIGVDFDRIQAIASDPAIGDEAARLRRAFGLDAPLLGVGVDRLDYTKGIPERLAALDRLLTMRPDLRGRLTFVQVGVPSRSELESYSAIEAEIDARVAAVNRRHAVPGFPLPIFYHKQALKIQSLVPLFRMARFCIVSSLHDGMNLVAKEFVAARDDLAGVLVLSELAGAAQELCDALVINPYDVDGFADALSRAIDMPAEEQARRMGALRRTVAGRNVFDWASDILDGLDNLWTRPLLYSSSAEDDAA